ncbi:MAG: 23S rRNA (uracil(1939)-C(5))-methyltransferase RlmD [Candidatus Magasanikbacteria bacterium]|nr:23S rRNA (uracil(1939)-C(5))-methyltransferase RlmD [Candidatus Magasanikbacteria bacterium]
MSQVKIEKLVFGGQGLGRVGERVVFVTGGYPGEIVEFQATKQKKNFIEGVVANVIESSPDRVAPVDDHFMSCSPWQTLTYEAENKWKVEIAKETYQRIAKLDLPDLTIESLPEEYHYRNKMEYNFFIDDKEILHFAFHDRGTHHLRPIGECALASREINEAGERVLQFLNKHKVPRRSLKSAIIRSDGAGHSAIALFIKDKMELPAGELLSEKTLGVQVYLSDYRSPASVPTELLQSVGQNYLEITIRGVKLRFGLLSFFQINPPIFEKVIEAIRPFITNEKIVDYYSGVGAIGLALARDAQLVTLVEENKEAVELAKGNIASNSITNANAYQARAEASLDYITSDSTVIVDPPRIGLHPDVLTKLLNEKPKHIVYLSCGIDTQARDLLALTASFKLVFWQVYNFFPRTPHIESLCVLELKA